VNSPQPSDRSRTLVAQCFDLSKCHQGQLCLAKGNNDYSTRRFRLLSWSLSDSFADYSSDGSLYGSSSMCTSRMPIMTNSP